MSRTFEFFHIHGAAEKNKENVGANGTGFSVEFFGSQSVEMFCCQENKSQMLSTSSRSMTRIQKFLLKSLGLYGKFLASQPV